MFREHLVVGYGEVGSALKEVLETLYEVGVKDLWFDDGTTSTDVLHICFPWFDGFEESVKEYQEQFEPMYTVVHSTVPVGTCSKLDVCHSPVRGKHPHLAESIRTFVKFFGGKHAVEVSAYFQKCGVPSYVVDRSETTEAGKLWELLTYGLAIAQQKEMYRWCEDHEADPEVAYQVFSQTYNEGYQAMGDDQFTKPIIEPMEGPIGGHCIIQTSPMVDHELSRLLRQLNKDW